VISTRTDSVPRNGRALSVEYKALTDLKPYSRNARTHSKHQIRQIAESIRGVRGAINQSTQSTHSTQSTQSTVPPVPRPDADIPKHILAALRQDPA